MQIDLTCDTISVVPSTISENLKNEPLNGSPLKMNKFKILMKKSKEKAVISNLSL
jgi:hypothetical protein